MTAVADSPPAPYRLTQTRVLRSEWSKLWSLRSTWIALIAAFVLTVGLAVVSAHMYDPSGEDGGQLNPVQYTLLGTQFGQVIIAVLGILVTAGEYATGMIRATVSAVPRRLPVLWAKAAAFGAAAFGTLLAAVFVSFLSAQLFLSGTDMEAALGDPGVARALTGTAAGLALIGVLTLALGSLLRSVAGAVGAYIGGLIVLPEVASMLPFDGIAEFLQYMPISASAALMTTGPGTGMLEPGTALLTLTAWAAAGLALAAAVLVRRDV